MPPAQDGSGVSLAAARLPTIQWGQLPPGGAESQRQGRSGDAPPGALRILAWLSVKPLLVPDSSIKPLCTGRINHAVR